MKPSNIVLFIVVIQFLSITVAHSTEEDHLSILDIKMGMSPEQVNDSLTSGNIQEMPSNDQILTLSGETVLGVKTFMTPFNKPNPDPNGMSNILRAYYSKPPTSPKLIRLERELKIGTAIIPFDLMIAKLEENFGPASNINKLRLATVMTWYVGPNTQFCATQNPNSADPKKCSGIMLNQTVSLHNGASGPIVGGIKAILTDLGEYGIDRKRFESYANELKKSAEKKQMKKSKIPEF